MKKMFLLICLFFIAILTTSCNKNTKREIEGLSSKDEIVWFSSGGLSLFKNIIGSSDGYFTIVNPILLAYQLVTVDNNFYIRLYYGTHMSPEDRNQDDFYDDASYELKVEEFQATSEFISMGIITGNTLFSTAIESFGSSKYNLDLIDTEEYGGIIYKYCVLAPIDLSSLPNKGGLAFTLDSASSIEGRYSGTIIIYYEKKSGGIMFYNRASIDRYRKIEFYLGSSTPFCTLPETFLTVGN
ncbi:MAG: hypothetical protein LBV51_01605 [Acholeplasmatales bacterium]|jgi:hypothetical protein|nr:hypothetical protein [Acholeplasmatales bacterium]